MVLRKVPFLKLPEFAVVWKRRDGGGEDVAWFFDQDLAEEYIGIYAGQGLPHQGKSK